MNNKEYLKSLPPGFRFKPTDLELCSYLFTKIHGKRLPFNPIKDVKLYDSDPLTLTVMNDNELFNGKNTEWYFFSPQNRKYPKGGRPERAAGEGYWKMTGACDRIEKNKTLVGLKKKLVYYEGKPSKAVKTNWHMHEYVLSDSTPITRTGPDHMRLNDWVLCRLYKKIEPEKKQRIDITIGGLPQPQHVPVAANDDPMPLPVAANDDPMPLPVAANDDQLYWADYNNSNITHQMPIVPNDGSLISTAPPPMTEMASADQVHWADNPNLDMHQIATGSNYGSLVSSTPPNDQSLRVDNDTSEFDWQQFLSEDLFLTSDINSIPPNDESHRVDNDTSTTEK